MSVIRKTLVGAAVAGLALSAAVGITEVSNAATNPRPVATAENPDSPEVNPQFRGTRDDDDNRLDQNFRLPGHFPFCQVNWGSQPKFVNFLSTAALDDVQVGASNCFDRVVFRFRGLARGFDVRYANHVLGRTTGQDLVPYTAGNFDLKVTLNEGVTLNPDFDTEGEHVGNELGFGELRDVVYGGSRFNRTTFAVGVERFRPFRVTTVGLPGNNSALVLDVAR
jgi:hypothetical protein